MSICHPTILGSLQPTDRGEWTRDLADDLLSCSDSALQRQVYRATQTFITLGYLISGKKRSEQLVR